MKKILIQFILALVTFAALTGNPGLSYAQGIVPDIIVNGAVPTVFLQEGVTVPNKQSAPTFTPDGNTMYLSDNDTVKVATLQNGKWSKPVTVSFSGRWHDWDAVLSPDGKTMVFVSDRPLSGDLQEKSQNNNQLWISELISGSEWSAPKFMDKAVNPDGISSYGPSFGKKRTLYFSSIGRDGSKTPHAYYSKWLGDHYDVPIQLDLNGDNQVLDPYVAPDERFIIFKSGYDLYISYRQGQHWSAPCKLGPQVNNGGYNSVPRVSRNGKILYYSSSKTKGILMIPINIPRI